MLAVPAQSPLRRRLSGLLVIAVAFLLTNCSLDELVSPTPGGVLTVAPLELADSARVGSTALRTQTVTVGVSGATTAMTFGVTAQLGSAWIVEGLGTGTAPNDWTIGFDPSGLAVGEYRDTLRVSNSGPDSRLVLVPVLLRILPCEITDLGALPAAESSELTAEDCASTSQTDRFAKRFQFTGAVNDSVTVRVIAADFTPRVTLRRTGAMTPLGFADECPATGSGACTRYLHLTEAGTYEVEVTSTAAAATGAFQLLVAPPRAPAAPNTLSQRVTTDLTQVIAAGSTLSTDRIALRASLTDADLDSLRLEIELRPIATPFTNTPTSTSALLPGPTFTQTLLGLTDNTVYRWQARAVDVTGRTSAWVAFGDGSADFSVGVPEAPMAPSALIQRKVDGTTPIALGGTTDESIIRLGATVNDPDPADQVRLELEVRSLGTPFTNVATHSSAPQPPGTSILVSVAGLVDNGQYRWQSRAVDQTGRTSAWTPFGGASTHFRTALTPAQLSFLTGPSTAAAGAAITPSVRVAVQGAGGSTLASYTGPVTLALDNANGATLGGSTTINAVAGVATFTDLSVDLAGSGYTLTATAGSLEETSAEFDVTSAAAANMQLSGVPAVVTAGQTLAALTVTVRDALGNVATGFTGTVSLALAANADDAQLLGTTSVAAVAGVATFGDVRVERASSAVNIVASATGLANVSSTPFAVVAAAPAELALITEPATAAASGVALVPQPVLEIRDAFGNPVLVAGTAVSATIASGPAGSSLNGASVNSTADGRATFSALAIVGAAGSYALEFSAGALTAAPAASITIGAGVATQLTLTIPPPATAVNGVAFGSEVRARLRDAAGNQVLQAGVSVTVGIASGGGSLTGTTTVLTNTMGQAIFSDLGILGTVGARTLSFASAGLTGVTSGTVTLEAGAATTLALEAGDGQTAAAGGTVTIPPSVIARDVSGNPVAGVDVTFEVASGGGVIVPPGLVVTGANGIAALTTWTLGGSAGTNTLTASAEGLDGSPILFTATATAGAASQMTITGGDDLTGEVATALGTPHEVRITDATGNPVAGVTVNWTALGGGSVAPASSVTDADGRATTERTLGPTAGAQSTQASATLAGGATSVTFDITATVGGATQLTLVTGDAQVDTVGATLVTPLTVLVRDALNNPVEGVLITWSVLAGGGAVTPTTSLTNASGIATTSWRLGTTRTATDSTQIVRASGVATPITFVALARPGVVNPSQTLVSVLPTSVAASRSTPATVTVTARDGFGNPVAGVPVTLAATGAGNTFSQPAGVTSATGVATGAVGATVTGVRNISATVDGVLANASPTLTVVAAPASALLFLDGPSTAIAGDDLAPSPSVGVLDSLGNRNFTYTGTITLGLGVNPNSGALTGTLSRSAVAGVASFTGVAIDRAGAGYQLSATAPDLVAAQSGAITVSAGALSAARSTVSVDPASIVAGSGTSTITVTALDENDNPIAGLSVVLSASGSNNSLTQPVAVTDATGVATGSISATTTGNRTISATIDGLAVTQTAVVSVVAGAVSPTLSTITGIPSTLVAGVETSNVTVTARDALGNAIAGATVVITATGSGNTITQPLGPTNASGVALGTFVSTFAEAKTLSATINGVELATSANVTVNAGAVSASRSLVAAAPDSIVAAEGTSTITVTARDANDNPISGAAVVLSATGAGNSLTQPAGPTAANGITTGTLGSTAVGNKTVTATINGIAITQSALVRVFSAGVSAAQSAVEITDATIVAGDSTTVTVIARDANGNAVSGAAVVLASDGTGDVITQPESVTDAGGVATGRVLATSADTRTISATIAGIAITQTVELEVTPSVPDAEESSLEVVPTSIAADGTAADVTVTVRDEFGNGVPGVAVVLAASGAGNALTQPGALTDALGVATGSISATIAGDRDISATADGLELADTVTLSVTPAAVSAAQSSVSVDPAALTAGVGNSTVTIVARDANGNVVPGLAVTFAVSGSGNTLTQPAAVTDVTGTATGIVSSTGAGSKTVTATIAGVVVTQTASLTVSPAAISAATSTVGVSAGTISAGVGSTTITVTVRDAFNNPIPGVLVELAATGTDNTLTQPAAVTNAAGVATGTFSSTNSESKTISATADGLALTQTATVTVVPDAASATASLVSASATTLVAGTDTATITVTARDVNENPVPGVAVTFEANGSGIEFIQPADVTDANGVATGRVTGTVVGARTVTALLNGVPASTTLGFTITPAAVSGDSTLILIAPQSIVAGAATATVTVTARDAFGNVVPGVTVELGATGASASLTQPAAVTDASGVTTGGITATIVGAKIVSATVNGEAVTMTDTLTVTPAAVSASESTIGAAPPAITAGGAASTITVTARDAFGNVVPGLAVTLNASGSNNTLVQPVVPTNASGVATGTLASNVAGARTVGASIAGTPITATTTVTVNPAAVSASLSTLGAEPSSVVAGGTPSTLTVQVRDLFGNPVPGATVLLVASGANNTVVQPAPTDIDGLTTGTLTSLTAQTKSVQAIANGVVLAGGVDVIVTAGAVSTTNSSLTATPGTLTAGAGSSTITVTARDANSNVIPNADVVLFATGDGNTLTQPSGATGVDGVASGALSSTGAGVKSVTATVDGVLLAASPSVTVGPAAISGGQSLLALDPASIVADGTATVTATVAVRDAFGNPITGATVVVSAAPSAGTTINGPLAQTNALGVTTATIASTVSGDKTISATAGGVAITGTQVLAVTPGAVSGTQSTIEASDASIVAGSETSTITVIARDAEGNLVPNAAVTLSASGSGNSFAPANTGNTDANGEFEATFSSTAIGTKTITASIGGTAVSGSALVAVTVAPISAAQSLVSATPTTLVAGADTSVVTVTVRDEFNNPIQGATVTFGATGDGNTLFNPVGTTNASGITTGRFTSESAGAKVLTATAGGTALTQTVNFTVTSAGVSADESSLSVAPAQITAGTTDSTEVTVTARDEFGNLISGASVQLLVSGGTNNFASPAGNTDVDGVFVGYVRSTSAGAKVISATIGGVTVLETGTVTVIPAAISAGVSTVAVSTPTLFAGSGAATVTVTVRDAFSNPISGATVVVSSDGSTNLINGPLAPTNAAGVATATFSSTVSELKTISATANGTPLTQQPTINVIPGEISAAQSEVVASVGTVVAGSGSSTITVTARDANGNAVPGVAVTIVSPSVDVVFTQPGAVTDANGVATGSIGATIVGVKRISAELNGVAVVDTVDVSVTPAAVNAGTTTVTADPTSITAGGTGSTITVTARDAFGNAVPSADVEFAATGTGNTLTPSATTNPSGVATGTLTSTGAAIKTVSVTVNGVLITQTAAVTVTPAAASLSLSTITANPTEITTDGSSTITVQLRDAFNNALTTSGGVVALGTTVGELSVVTNNNNGSYTATLTSDNTGTATITGTLGGLDLVDDATVVIGVGEASLALSTIVADPTSITTDGSSTITVQLRDGAGNNLTESAGTVALSTTRGLLTAVTDNLNGTYTASLTSTSIGSATITGTLDGADFDAEATVVIGVGAPSPLTSQITANPTAINTDGSSTITVQLRDAANNNLTLPSGTVTLDSDIGVVGAVSSVGNGTYTATFTSGTLGTATITGEINGQEIADQATVAVSIGGASLVTSTITASPDAITTDGSSTITVQLRDAAGNALTDNAGTVTLDGTIGDDLVVSYIGNGAYTAAFTSGALGTSVISGTLNGNALEDTAGVTVSIGLPDPATTQITALPTAITTDNSSVITVQVRDGAGNNFTTGGATVTLATNLGDLTVPTDVGNGTYTATLTSDLPGTATITGQLNAVAITDNATVTVQLGAPSLTQSSITASATAITTDEGSTITVQLRDAAGNVLTSSGGVVTLFTTLGTLGAVTDVGNGTYTAGFTSTALGAATISGELDGEPFTDTEIITVSVGAPSAAQTTITADPISMSVDGSSVITVQLRDAAENNITTGVATIVLETDLGELTDFTNVGNGTYTATLTSEAPGSATISGTLNAAPIADNAVVTVTAGAVSAALSTISVNPTSIVAGVATSTVTITARDQFGNPIQGVAASFAPSGTGNNPVQPVGTTGLNGVLTGTISSTVAEQKSIVGTAGGVAITTPAILTVTPAAVSAANSTLSADSPSIVASSGASTSTITLTARDEFNNPIANAAVTFLASGSVNSFAPASGVTSALGVLTTNFSSETAEPKTISAEVAGTLITQTAAVSVTPAAASAATSQITANPTSVSADVGTSTLTVTLRDGFNNALVEGGDVVTLATTIGTIGTVTDNGNGTYTATLTATDADTAEISGTVNAVAITDTATVVITSGGVSAAQSSVEVSSETLVAGAPAVIITVTARDAAGNAVEGATVVLGATGDNTLTQPVGPTDANGVATGSLAATLVGERIISATAAGVAITETASVTVTPAVASTATSTITASSNNITTDGNSTLTVQLRDQYSNLVTTSGGLVALTPSIGAVGEVTDNLNGTYTAVFSSSALGTANITGTLAGSPFTDTEDITITVGNSAAGTTTISAADASITAGGSTTLTVQLRDAAGNARTTSNGTIELSASIGSITDLTDVGNGTWTATFTSNVAGAATISGELNEVAITDTEPVTVNAAAVSAGVSTVTAGAPTIVAGSGSSLITVTALDQFSNPVEGASVEFETSGSGNSFAPSASATTDLNGQATATFASTQAIPKVIVVTVGTTEITQRPTVTVTPAAINAGTSSVVLTPSSVAATVNSTVTVTARDAFSNPVPGATVTFSATGTGNSLTQPAADTDLDGVATGSISSTFAEEKVITAIAGGVTITQTPTLTVTVGGVSPSQSTVVAQQASIVANDDGSATSTILVTARDGNGNPMEGATVTLASDGTDNVFVQPAATDENGETSGTIRSTRAELKTITATINDVPILAQPTVTVTAAAASAAQSIISADPISITTDQTSAITVQARDAFQNLRTSASGAVLLNSSIGGALTVTDNENGTYSATLDPASTGIATISGTLGGAAIGTNATVTITAGAAALATSQVTVANSTITAGGNTAVTVTLRDAENSALTTSGGTVTLQLTLGSVGSIGSVTDNTNGTYTATFSSDDAGSATIEARLDGNLITDVANVTVETGAAAAAQSSVAADSTSITASNGSNTTTITVTVRDALDNPVAGATVTLSADGTDNFFTQPVGVTNAAGQITGVFWSTRAEAKELTATVGGSLIISQTAGVTVVPAPASAATSTLSATPTSVTADQTSTITVQLIDAFGNVRSDGAATLVLNATSGGVSAPVNQNDGTYDATFTPDETGTITIGGTLGDVNIVNTTTVTVTPGAPSGAESSIALDPASITASSGASTSTITATARDANGNAIPGATVVISATGTGNALNQAVTTADGGGAVTATISSTVAESKTISALINGTVAITPTQSLTVAAGAMDPDASSLELSDPTIIASNGSEVSTITATIRDVNNNPISNATVSFLANGVTTGLSAATALTNSAGVAEVTFSSSATGVRTIQASVSAVALTDEPTIEVTPAAASLTASLITASDESITSDETSTITVQLRDEFNNNLTASAGTVTLLATPGGALTVTPVGDGSYTATFDATTATTVTITGQLDGLDLTDNVVITVAVGAVSATQSAISADPTSFVAGNSTTIEVIARDGANNLIQNVSVVLGFTGNAGSLTQPTGNTDVAGQATGSFAATLIGDRTISATVGGVLINATAIVSVTPAASDATETLITTADASFTAGGSTIVTIQVRDEFGNVVTSITDVIELDSSIGEFTSVTSTGPGTYQATFSSDSADVATITGTLNTVAITDDATVTVDPGAATTLVIVAQPSVVDGGIQFPSAIQVQARDQYGNLASSFSGTVTVALQAGLESDLVGTKSLSASNGVVSFADLVFNGPEASIVLVVSAVGVTNSGVSTAITVNP